MLIRTVLLFWTTVVFITINEVAVQMIQAVGAIVHFLPLYSSDYNPIEEAFSKVKAEMKAMEKEAQVTDIETVVLAAFSCITVSEWIKDS